MDITQAAAPRSDQINADELALSGPITVTVKGASKGSVEQPLNVHLVEFPSKAYRPNKTMMKILGLAWGMETDAWIGNRMTLFRNPNVKFGKDTPGGIEISHLSEISGVMKESLTVSKGRKRMFEVQPLPDVPTPPPIPAFATVDEARAYYGKRSSEGAPPTELTAIRNAAPTQKENHA